MRTSLIFCVLLLLAPAANAHALRVACVIRGDKVNVETFYSDGTLAPQAKIQVINANDERIADGETDAQGRWTFARPEVGTYDVRADAGAGHRARRTLHVSTTSTEPPDDQNVPAVQHVGSEEGSRDELTQTPWLKIALGLIVIVGLSGAYLIAQSWRRSASRAP